MGADLELVAGGRPLRFPAVWLRDNCPCPECRDPGTGQKRFDITGVPSGLGITLVEDAGESVLVTSVRALARQGGPMTPEQAAAFEALPYARDAVAVRRWDDQAKDPAVTPPEFSHFAALLRALLEGDLLRS
jgi:hypothetical protein